MPELSAFPPLKALALSSAPLSTHAIAWSADAELADAVDDAVSIFFPTFPNAATAASSADGNRNTAASATARLYNDTGGGGSLNTTPLTMLPASVLQTGQFFSHRTRWPCTRPPEQRLNAALLAAAGVRPRAFAHDGEVDEGEADEGEANDDDDDDDGDEGWTKRRGQAAAGGGVAVAGKATPAGVSAAEYRWWEPGTSVVTRHGAAMSQAVALAWSPAGLGHNLRPVLGVLTTAGAVVVYGEHASPADVERELGSRVRSVRGWAALWGVGARLPLVDRRAPGGYRACDDRAVAFAWARPGGGGEGEAWLAYATARGEVVVMAVAYRHRAEGCAWGVEEAARFAAHAPHGGEASVSCGGRGGGGGGASRYALQDY
jgi:hypothetical protein